MDTSMICFPSTIQKCVELQSIVLFDMLATDFTIRGVWAVRDGCPKVQIPGKISLQGAGIGLNYLIKPPWRVHVKVICAGRYMYIQLKCNS